MSALSIIRLSYFKFAHDTLSKIIRLHVINEVDIWIRLLKKGVLSYETI